MSIYYTTGSAAGSVVIRFIMEVSSILGPLNLKTKLVL